MQPARLEDRAEIADQMYRYARATDWLETEMHREVFVDDCVFASPHSGDMHGIDAVVEWMNSKLAAFEATQHMIGNIAITFTGDDTATAVSYVRAWHRWRDHTQPDMVLWGYDSLVFYDHVVGAQHADRDPALWGPYTEHDPFHDPFVAIGYAAAITRRIELATAVLILPQRQTVLVAQQAADVALLSKHRVRLGVGTGWNWVEYDALGQDFASRGRRLSEQVPLLRRLWDEPLVSFEGEFDRIDRGCINPRPLAPIPVWFGGFGEAAFGRASVLGDGFSFAGDVDTAIAGLRRVRELRAEAGRSDHTFGTELLMTRARTVSEIVETTERWQAAGGSQVSVITMKHGLADAAAHVDQMAAFRTGLERRFG